MHNISCCSVFELLLVVSLGDECEEKTLNAERGLDNIRYVLLVRLGVEVFELLTARLDMLCEVLVCSVGNSPEFAPTEREHILEVGSSL